MKLFGILVAGASLLASALSAKAEPVKIVNIGHSYYAAGLYIAQQEKIFQKYGLEPTVTVVGGGPLALQAILSGNVDFGVVSYEHVLAAAVQGKPMVSFFNLVNRPTSNVIASTALVAEAKGLNPDAKIRLLKGKRIGVPAQGGSGDKLTRALIALDGMSASDVSMVFSGADTGSYIAALKRGLIDAAVVPEPAGLIAREQNVGGVYLDFIGGEVPTFNDMIYMSLTATPESVAKKRDLLGKVTAVFAEAQRIIKDEPERALAAMKKEYPEMSDAMNRELFKLLNQAWSKDGVMSEAQAKATADYLKPSGDHPLELAKTFTNEFLPKK
ncbi:ABC transporter substrate-binding protein [Bosea caraganae]|uniref:ABC transporter substrate-binding protein n=1 Tax=Bosea caraganae TaxID=2763117 RepID=A0A370L9I8_9HYPH|nr:ABC transporter substrate-binding protein [Bosea caraganae]RDJ26955.1 ABC transporter substrate-binding protein [Bosea caraganae]RDJ30842.1 ABC transporter substrate-binding protein [Bosea caraganae]